MTWITGTFGIEWRLQRLRHRCMPLGPSSRDKSPCIHRWSASETDNQSGVHVTGVMGVMGVMPMRRRVKMLATARGDRASEPSAALKEMPPRNQQKARLHTIKALMVATIGAPA